MSKEEPATPHTPFERFVKRILAVPPAELDEQKAKYERDKRKRKRKPHPRVSSSPLRPSSSDS